MAQIQNIRKFLIILPLLFLFLGPHSANAATLTYNNDNGSGDFDWANTSDWQTGIIAGTSDTALVTASVNSISSGVASVSSADFSNGSIWGTGLTLTVQDMATFNDTSYSNGIINGNATFDTTWYSGTTAPSGGVFTINGSNSWLGEVTGTVYGSDAQAITSYIFNNSSYNAGSGTINGNTTFNNASYNTGIINGNAVFNNSGVNQAPGKVVGDAIFNDTTLNAGTITGNTTFNDASTNQLSGTINGNAAFNDTSYTLGTINGNATFNDTSYLAGGTINGNATFDTTWYSGTTAPSGGVLTVNGGNDWFGDVTGTVYGSDAQSITSYIFNDSSNDQGTLTGNAAFNDTSYLNGGTINGNATFDTTWYSGTTAPSGGILTVNGSNDWSGSVTGTVYGSDLQAITSYIFNDTSYDFGTFTGNATFNDTSRLDGGTINGNATFDTTWYSGTTAPSGGVLTVNGGNDWSGDVKGTVYGSDLQAITSYIFNDTSSNSGTINGNATFNDTSFNSGTIFGNATFDTTWYSGTTAPSGGVFTLNGGREYAGEVRGTAYGSDGQMITSYVFNDSSQNIGTINGNATFNDVSDNYLGIINGNATFNDNTYNNAKATVVGNASFNGASYNEGIIDGNATFDTTWYSGTTAPSGGIFTINGNNFWSGDVTGTVYGSDDQAITSYVFNDSSQNAGIINGSVVFDSTAPQYGTINAGSGTVSGNFTISPLGITLESGTVSSDISGIGELSKTGTGTVTLTGSNSYSGPTVISDGILKVGNNGTTGSLGTGPVIDNANLSFDLTNGYSVSNIISGTGTLTQNGTGTVTLSGVNTYSGATTVNAGTLEAGTATQAFGLASAVSVAVGGTLDLGGYNEMVSSLAGAGNVTNSGGADAVLTTGAGNTSTIFSGNITNGLTNSVGLAKLGSGTLTLSGDNTYTGATNLDAGTLDLGSSNAMGTGALIFGGGTLQYSPGNNNDYSGQFSSASGQLYNIDTNGQNVTFADQLNSTGGVLTKTGNGTLTLTNANSYSGGTTINAGTLQAGNANALGTGPVTNSGTLAIGTTSLTLGGAYTQNAGSALDLTVTRTNNGQIIAPSVSIDAGSTINVTVQGLVPNNTAYEIINSGGTGIGSVPSTVLSDSFVSFSSSVLNGDLFLTSDYTLYSLADNPNARAVANDIDNDANVSSDMGNVFKTLQTLSNGQISSALDSMGPVVDAGILEDSSSMLNNFVGAALDRVQNVLSRENIINNSLDIEENSVSEHRYETGISSGDDVEDNGIWAKPFGSYLTQEAKQSIPGYNAWNTGTVVGFDHMITDDITLGLAGSYAYGSLDSADGSNTGITSTQGTIYAGYQDPDLKFFLEAAGSFAWDWYDGKRNITFMDRTADSSYDGQGYSLYLGSGYNFYAGKSPEYGTILGENFVFTPLASLEWTHRSLGSYTETNAGALDLKVNGQDYDTLESSLGASFSSPEKYYWGVFTPELHAKWLYDYISDKMTVTSAFVNDGGSFTFNGITPMKNAVDIGGKMSFDLKDNMSLIAAFDSELKNGFLGIYGSGTVRYRF